MNRSGWPILPHPASAVFNALVSNSVGAVCVLTVEKDGTTHSRSFARGEVVDAASWARRQAGLAHDVYVGVELVLPHTADEGRRR